MGKGFLAFSVVFAGWAGIAAATDTAVPSAGATIHVSFASYGYAGERKDVKDDVVKYCEGKPSCGFPVANQSFGLHPPVDPSPGNDKGVIVGWQCGTIPGKAQFAEGRGAAIDCR